MPHSNECRVRMEAFIQAENLERVAKVIERITRQEETKIAKRLQYRHSYGKNRGGWIYWKSVFNPARFTWR